MPQPYVLMIGGLRPEKGGVHLLAVAQLLHERGSDIQMVIAGPNAPELASRAQILPNVHLIGMVPDSELPGLVKHAVTLVFLSLYEGFGIPPLEAMAAGTPAIVADRASLPEVVGDAGFVVPPDDSATVAAICTILASDKARRCEVVAKGRAHAARFTWEGCAAIVLDRLASDRS